jgi:predicted permease
MSWATVTAAKLRALFGRKRLDRELDEEVRFHLDMQIEDNLRGGMSPSEARYAAHRSFGGVEPMKEAYREGRVVAIVEAALQDIRYALRTLRKNPGFTISSVAVLALAIGANTAMFSVLDAVILQPLPYRSPEQLAMLWTEIPSQNAREGRTAYQTVEEWRRQTKSFADLAIFDPTSVTLTTSTHTQQMTVARVSPNYFPLLGIQPLHGRMFSSEEAEQRQRLIVLGYHFWQTRFGGSVDAIGASIQIDGMASRIAGILPDHPLLDNDIWEPHTMFPDWETRRAARGAGPWFVIGRLHPRVTIQQAQAEMNTIARRLDASAPPAARNLGVAVVPLSVQMTGPQTRLVLWMMAGTVFCVLLIAAANVAGLSLARSVSREKEIAIRAALGASRARIVRQLLAESLTLAILSGLLGLIVANLGVRLILAFKPAGVARLDQVGLHPQVLAGALAFCILTGLLVGLAPAITMARRSLRSSSQEGGRSIAGGVAAGAIRRVLVVAEFALAIMLLAGTGLLVRSLWALQSVDPGFKSERVLLMQISSPPTRVAAQRVDFQQRVVERIEALPGIEGAGLIGDIFIGGNAEVLVTTEGNEETQSQRLRFRSDEISSGFFRTMATPLLKGRIFSAQDGPESPRVAIINDTMARRLWPGGDPVGRRFKFGPADSLAPWRTVVGVAADMRRQGLEKEPIPQMFEPLAQNSSRNVNLLVKTATTDPLTMSGVLQAAVREVDRNAPVYGVATLQARLAGSLVQRKFQTALLIAFSIAALLMAAIGIYGLIQYSIAMRTHEIGIRMAIGAQAGEIFRMILGEGLTLSLTGLAIGLIGAVWVGRAASSLLFGVTSHDPITFLSVSLLLTVVAMTACYFPARRAMKVEPVTALRLE